MAKKIAGALVRWFDGAKRAMPWRGTRDAYAIWVSETMLQQTQVATVVPYYLRFMERFPTVGALAKAELSEVLALWAGLGYYRRAKHLHMGAKMVVERFGGKVPGTVEGLMELPGVGRYTAGAVGSMAFGLAVPVVDGNVVRVLARVYGYGGREREFYWERAGEWVRAAPSDKATERRSDGGGRYGDVNQGMMELGATVCTPAAPACGECPLRGACVARKEGRQGELPVKVEKRKVPVVRRRVVVVIRKQRRSDAPPRATKRRRGGLGVLMMERPGGGLWEHMWEFPTVDIGVEDVGAALGVKLSAVKKCGEVRHALTHRVMEYEVWVGEMKGSGGVKCVTCDGGVAYAAVKWAEWPLAERHELPMAKVVGKIAEMAGAVFG